jgi:hypothetical protein
VRHLDLGGEFFGYRYPMEMAKRGHNLAESMLDALFHNDRTITIFKNDSKQKYLDKQQFNTVSSFGKGGGCYERSN